jgi:Ca-activated chloride channel family protein
MILKRLLPTRLAASLLTAVIFSSAASAQTETPVPAQAQEAKQTVIVLDNNDRVVEDVRKEDLQVIEDGATQAISSFARDDRPVTCGFVIDASGSVRRILNQLIDSAKIAAEGLRAGDEAFVARFVGRDMFQIKEEITTDFDAISDALDDIYVEGGETAIHDAIEKTLKYLEDNQTGDRNARRRILILITDGEDRASKIKDAKTILARVRQSDVQIFVLALTKFSGLQSSANKATDLLSGLAEQSGGRAFFPNFSGGLPDAAKEVARTLHTQFVVGYAGKGKSAGSERRVQVKWVGRSEQGKRKVITRPVVTMQ